MARIGQGSEKGRSWKWRETHKGTLVLFLEMSEQRLREVQNRRVVLGPFFVKSWRRFAKSAAAVLQHNQTAHRQG